MVTPNSKKFMYTEFYKSAPPDIKEHVTKDLFNKENLEKNTLDVLSEVYVTHSKDNPKSESSYNITKSMSKQVQNYSSTVLAKKMKMSWKKVKEFKAGGAKRKTNRRQISEHTRNAVNQFYLRDDISRPDPSNRAKTKKLGPRRYMYMPLDMAYTIFADEFRQKWPQKKIPLKLAKFKMLRPKNVKYFSSTPHESCLCVYCVNVRHKLTSLKNRHPDPKSCNFPSTEHEFYNYLLCPRQSKTFPNSECVQKTCESCKEWEKKILDTYSSLDQHALVKYQYWEKEEYTTKSGKIRTRRKLVIKNETVSDCINNLISDTVKPTRSVTFIRHYFTFKWQYSQYLQNKENLKSGQVLIVQDFAKNREIVYQDEIKSHFFSKGQITMHPSVCFFKTNDGQVKRVVIIHLSDITDHSAHLVNIITSDIKKCLQEKYAEESFNKFFLWSDGCSAQYKGKHSFFHLCQKQDVERNFFGSEHGKGESDTETAIINSILRRAIISRKVIVSDARDAYNYLVSYESKSVQTNTERIYHLIECDELTDFPYVVSTLSGSMTRKLHQVKSTHQRPYCLDARPFSCFCAHCCDGNFSDCEKSEHTLGSFSQHTLKVTTLEGDLVNNQNDEEDLIIENDPPLFVALNKPPRVEDLVENNYVLVNFKTSTSKVFKYVAKIKEIKDNDIIIDYMKKQPGNKFVFQEDKPDYVEQTLPIEHVVMVLPSPQVLNRGRYEFPCELKVDD